MGFLTPRRIRTYPWVILGVVWTAILINWAGSDGWRGWGGQVLFSDFIVFYGAGVLFREAPESLYDFGRQLSLHQALVAPTPLPGTGPFVHPPYVAPLLDVFSYVPLPMALAFWTALSCLALAASIVITWSIFRDELGRLGISRRTAIAIAFSLPAIVAGLYSGQMHAFVLLGTVGVVALSLRGHMWAAGAVAGLLAIKPQFALGFGIFFLARGELRACAAAVLAFAGLNGLLLARVGLATGLSLYRDYLETARYALQLPFLTGFPKSFLMTPYGLLAGLGGVDYHAVALVLSNVVAAGFLAWFAHDAWQLRRAAGDGVRLLLGRALLLPFLLSPYLLMHDAAALLLACILVTSQSTPHQALLSGAMVYAWLWVAPPVSGAAGIPIGVLAPAGVWIASERQYRLLGATLPRLGPGRNRLGWISFGRCDAAARDRLHGSH